MASLVLAFIFLKKYNIINYKKTKGKVTKMIAVIKYTDCMNDTNIVFGVLSQLNANIVKTDNKQYTIYHNITLCVENVEEINKILSVLNNKTTYGVVLLSCKKTFGERIKELFQHEQKDLFNG